MASSREEHATLDAPRATRPQDCPVENWLAFLGHRWTALILWHLQAGPTRYSTLASRLPGATAKVLQDRLIALVENGLIIKSVARAFPPTVHYRLTTKGTQLVAILNRLETWSRGFDVRGD